MKNFVIKINLIKKIGRSWNRIEYVIRYTRNVTLACFFCLKKEFAPFEKEDLTMAEIQTVPIRHGMLNCTHSNN